MVLENLLSLKTRGLPATESALREPTRPSPACCRPRAVEGPPAPDGEAPCGGGHWRVGKHAGTFRICRRVALAGPGRMLSAPHEKRTNAPTQKTPNSSFLILKKLPRRQLRHSGAAGPAKPVFLLPTQAVTAGAGGKWPRGLARRPQAPRVRCCPPHWGSSGGRGLWVTAAAERRRGTHRARSPLSASLGTFSAWRNHLARRRNFSKPTRHPILV